MKAAILFLLLQPLAAIANIFDTILPRVKPTDTIEYWTCTTKELETFFDVPKPTGTFRDALRSYASNVLKGCESTLTNWVGMPECTFIGQSRLCAFTKEAPSTVLSDFSSYASSVSSWWSARSSDAVKEAMDCPMRWWWAMRSFPDAPGWLNGTIAVAGCYDGELQSQVVTTTATTITAQDATAAAAPTIIEPESTGMQASRSTGATVTGQGSVAAESWTFLVGAALAAIAAETLF